LLRGISLLYFLHKITLELTTFCFVAQCQRTALAATLKRQLITIFASELTYTTTPKLTRICKSAQMSVHSAGPNCVKSARYYIYKMLLHVQSDITAELTLENFLSRAHIPAHDCGTPLLLTTSCNTHLATPCNTLQHPVTHCNTANDCGPQLPLTTYCNNRQHRNTLQHTHTCQCLRYMPAIDDTP